MTFYIWMICDWRQNGKDDYSITASFSSHVNDLFIFSSSFTAWKELKESKNAHKYKNITLKTKVVVMDSLEINIVQFCAGTWNLYYYWKIQSWLVFFHLIFSKSLSALQWNKSRTRADFLHSICNKYFISPSNDDLRYDLYFLRLFFVFFLSLTSSPNQVIFNVISSLLNKNFRFLLLFVILRQKNCAQLEKSFKKTKNIIKNSIQSLMEWEESFVFVAVSSWGCWRQAKTMMMTRKGKAPKTRCQLHLPFLLSLFSFISLLHKH